MSPNNSTCNPSWNRSGNLLLLNLPYNNLSGECHFDTHHTDGKIKRTANVSLFVLANGSVAKQWDFPVAFTFDDKVQSFFDDILPIWGAVQEVRAPRTISNQFGSSIRLYASGSYTELKHPPTYNVEEWVYVEQNLRGTQDLKIAVTEVFLSKSKDPKNTNDVMHNLTEHIDRKTSNELGQVRFSFKARACAKCYLHATSSVSINSDGKKNNSDRRLSAEERRMLMTKGSTATHEITVDSSPPATVVDTISPPKPGGGFSPPAAMVGFSIFGIPTNFWVLILFAFVAGRVGRTPFGFRLCDCCKYKQEQRPDQKMESMESGSVHDSVQSGVGTVTTDTTIDLESS
jgi:hypothetical protein